MFFCRVERISIENKRVRDSERLRGRCVVGSLRVRCLSVLCPLSDDIFFGGY